MLKTEIEFHPENGIAPWVVRIIQDEGPSLWFAYPTEDLAKEKLPQLEKDWKEANVISN